MPTLDDVTVELAPGVLPWLAVISMGITPAGMTSAVAVSTAVVAWAGVRAGSALVFED